MDEIRAIMKPGSISGVRKNHALEHATLQVLAERKVPSGRLFGYSGPMGFWIIGSVSTIALTEAAREALIRLQQGETDLAIHPRCGTNLAVTGLLAGLAGWVSFSGVKKEPRSWLQRFPLAMGLISLAILASQPLGPRIQRVFTTDARVDKMRILQVMRYDGRYQPIHRISTWWGE